MAVACQVCGRNAVGEGSVEGARVPLCETCSAYSSSFSVYKSYSQPKKGSAPAFKPASSSERELAEDYGKKIMQAREKKGFSRKELAQKLFIQEKELEGFEQQKYKPSETIVKKLEFALGISLFDQQAD